MAHGTRPSYESESFLEALISPEDLGITSTWWDDPRLTRGRRASRRPGATYAPGRSFIL
jgi:hypothetical protein